MKKGYSLIELTITVGLLSILALTISAIVLSTVVGSYRLRNLVHVREVGNYVTGQLERLIHNARSVTSCSSNTLTLLNQDNNPTTIQLSGTSIASSSASLTPSDVTVSNFSLICLPSSSDPQIVNLNFTLSTNSDPNARPHDNPSLNFSSSIEFRNN